jgi:hypothetical protein
MERRIDQAKERKTDQSDTSEKEKRESSVRDSWNANRKEPSRGKVHGR